jgi:hypothetical protein
LERGLDTADSKNWILQSERVRRCLDPATAGKGGDENERLLQEQEASGSNGDFGEVVFERTSPSADSKSEDGVMV